MWFVTEQHSAELGELGRLEGEAGAERLKGLAAALAADRTLSYYERWQNMSSVICTIPR